MCVVSDKIKFCTCTNDSVENLKHYWILYRFNKDKNDFCIGMPIMPTYMTDLSFEENQATLLNRLNEADAFDIPLTFKAKDIMEIVINNTSAYQDPFTYSFQYKKGKWITEETDSFEIMNHFDEEISGKIKNALKRNKKIKS
jgi:hypothetical protein